MKKQNTKFKILKDHHTRETCKNVTPKKFIYALVSVNGKEHRTRTWSFWSSKERAIKEGLYGFRSNGKTSYEFFSEQMYYTHLVVEKIALDYPLMINDRGENNIWFEFKPKKVKKCRNEVIKKEDTYWIEEYSCKRCKCPEEHKHTIGFAG